MRANGTADNVVCRVEFNDPGAKGFVDSVTESSRAGFHCNHFGAEKLHAKNVQSLAAYVLGAHVDDAFHSELCTDCGGCHTVLAGARLGNNASLAQTSGDEDLTNGIVDLVTSGMVEVFAFEIDICASSVSCQTWGEMKGGWAAHVLVM